MKLTREEAIQKHRELWNWIADETERRQDCVSKKEYFENIGVGRNEVPLNNCYCCEYAHNQTNTFGATKCESCPIWSFDKPCESTFESDNLPYDLWRCAYESGAWEKAAKYARIIANLPERSET